MDRTISSRSGSDSMAIIIGRGNSAINPSIVSEKRLGLSQVDSNHGVSTNTSWFAA
ncbi:hypothetical protein Lalb_Chr16g0388651 [Lupinus albus]|uniref:Uncharacterized protein n=1 Tax=Lupinus albus TaxID=3870 RepID=A0A6A4PA41_LUPAL|nr:hypothetical protein Lalb_Chr16g0388651 [Lupinus albus]